MRAGVFALAGLLGLVGACRADEADEARAATTGAGSPTEPASASATPLAIPGADGVVPEQVTYTEHVAPLILARCASCHRPGQVAPFALLDEADVRDHAEQIVEVTGSRFMPPWKPVPGHGEFAGDRSLTPAQIEIFARWVAAGTPTGPEHARPPVPEFGEGWLGGEPDLVLNLDEPYELGGEGLDRYRNFVIPAGVDRKLWVRGWELDPGNPKVVHHAILSVDRGGWARDQDAADPGPGFEAMEAVGGQSPNGFYLVWAPGTVPTLASEGTAWSLGPGTDLILQLHLQPSGKPEAVAPRIGLYLTDAPPTRPGLTLRVGDAPIDIAPGDADYVMTDTLELAADATLLSVFPHAHYLARSVEIRATLPDGSERWLLDIADWDFAWQDQYRYREGVALPAGTRVDLAIRYDNSAANPRNPHAPPRRVVTGPNSTDEMGNATFEVLPHDRAGLLALREAKYRRELRFGASATGHYNLANVLRDRGELAAAEAEYQAALALDPEHLWSLHNLSMLLQQARRFDEAIAVAEREVAVTPKAAAAHTNLGNALRGSGRTEDAVAAFRQALVLDPEFALARNSLRAMGVD